MKQQFCPAHMIFGSVHKQLNTSPALSLPLALLVFVQQLNFSTGNQGNFPKSWPSEIVERRLYKQVILRVSELTTSKHRS